MYGILYKPDNELVSFVDTDDKTTVLFTDDEATAVDALTQILYAGSGYEGDTDDFCIQIFDTDTNGSEYTTEPTEFIPIEKLNLSI